MRASLADLSLDDVVLEIGPGLGVMTEKLVQRAQGVIAIEKDSTLCGFLKSRFREATNLELIDGDVLDLDLDEVLASGVSKVVSNLPYAAGSRILVKLGTSRVLPRYILVTLQRDVAQRLAAKPGSKDYGVLSVYTQLDYEVAIEKDVSPSCFMPKPRIWSPIVTLRRGRQSIVQIADGTFFRKLLKWAFSHRRKQLCSLLRHAPHFVAMDVNSINTLFKGLNVNPHARPEALSVAEWGRNVLREEPTAT